MEETKKGHVGLATINVHMLLDAIEDCFESPTKENLDQAKKSVTILRGFFEKDPKPKKEFIIRCDQQGGTPIPCGKSGAVIPPIGPVRPPEGVTVDPPDVGTKGDLDPI